MDLKSEMPTSREPDEIAVSRTTDNMHEGIVGWHRSPI